MYFGTCLEGNKGPGWSRIITLFRWCRRCDVVVHNESSKCWSFMMKKNYVKDEKTNAEQK